MRKFYFFITCLLLTGLTSCKKSEKMAPVILEGTYKGTYERPGYAVEKPQVTLTFSANGTYTGSSSSFKFPAICPHGNFSVSGTKINFASMCYWTTDFDGTLVLSGDYDIEQNGSSVQISKSYGGKIQDLYILMKQ